MKEKTKSDIWAHALIIPVFGVFIFKLNGTLSWSWWTVVLAVIVTIVVWVVTVFAWSFISVFGWVGTVKLIFGKYKG